MKSCSRLFSLLLALAPLAAVSAPESTPRAAAESAPVKRHPLKGMVTGVLPEKSALMVRHEEIPGVMRAMTMMFKVDARTIATIKKGDTITGLLSRQGSDWVLEDVKIVDEKKR